MGYRCFQERCFQERCFQERCLPCDCFAQSPMAFPVLVAQLHYLEILDTSGCQWFTNGVLVQTVTTLVSEARQRLRPPLRELRCCFSGVTQVGAEIAQDWVLRNGAGVLVLTAPGERSRAGDEASVHAGGTAAAAGHAGSRPSSVMLPAVMVAAHHHSAEVVPLQWDW